MPTVNTPDTLGRYTLSRMMHMVRITGMGCHTKAQ